MASSNEHQISPNAQALRQGLPQRVKAVAMRNAKNRFFVPSTENWFGNYQYDYVMIDNGCNSFLLPYRMAAAARYVGDQYLWTISQSRGTGAVKSPTLVIKKDNSRTFASVSLAGSDSLLELSMLRFHLGTESARSLLTHAKLSEADKNKLRSFLAGMWQAQSPKRHHVLLGQTFLREMVSVQIDNMFMMCDIEAEFRTRDEYRRVRQLVEPMKDNVEGFDDLEDEDHDGDADEECSFEFIDEPNE